MTEWHKLSTEALEAWEKELEAVVASVESGRCRVGSAILADFCFNLQGMRNELRRRRDPSHSAEVTAFNKLLGDIPIDF